MKMQNSDGDLFRVAVSLVNYKNFEQTCSLVKSLMGQEGVRVCFYIIDNSEASELLKMQRLLGELGLLEVVRHCGWEGNIGYARAHNKNFSLVRKDVGNAYDKFVVSNSDVRISSARLLSDMCDERFEDCIVAPVIYMPDGGVWFAGGRISLFTGDLIVNRNPLAADEVTGFICGCFFSCSTGVFERLGGFNEKFFMYAEDLDLSLRAVDAGVSLVVAKHLDIVHEVGSGASGKYSALYLYENTKNRLACLKQYRLGLYPFSLVYFYLKYGAARLLQLSLVRDFKNFRPVLNAFGMELRSNREK
jgi:GT2 family glycosyltransferase